MHKGNCTVSKEANVFLPHGSMAGGAACCFSFVNRTQQRVRGLGFFKWGKLAHYLL